MAITFCSNLPQLVLSFLPYRQELGLLRLGIEDSLTLLGDLGILNALGHLDLNPWNVIASVRGSVFLDWAEAYVGPPFFSLEFLLQHFRRDIGANTAVEFELIQAYMAPWQELFLADLIRETLTSVPLAAVFADATGTDTWKDEEKLRDPTIAGTSAVWREG